MNKVTEALDKIAGSLEEKGEIRLAKELDVISNTVEALFMPGPHNIPGASPMPGQEEAEEKERLDEERRKKERQRGMFVPGPHNIPGAAPYFKDNK